MNILKKEKTEIKQCKHEWSSKIGLWWWLQNFVNLLNIIYLYGWILYYSNDTLLGLFKKCMENKIFTLYIGPKWDIQKCKMVGLKSCVISERSNYGNSSLSFLVLLLQSCFLPGQDIARNFALNTLMRMWECACWNWTFSKLAEGTTQFQSWIHGMKNNKFIFINPTFIKLMNRVQIM